MSKARHENGRAELRRSIGACRSHLAAVAVFSVFVNLLMLTGPLFMLQVYDRVLASRSEETLMALLLLVTGLFLLYGLLEFARGRVLARAGARFQSLLDMRVFEAVLRRSVAPAERALPNTAERDLDSIRMLLAGPAPFALFDIPWTPIFMAAIFLFHPLLGAVAIGGGAVLIVLALVNQLRSRRPGMESLVAGNQASNLSEALRQNAEVVQGLGMRGVGLARWQALRETSLGRQIEASDRTASYASASRALRFWLQSFMLAAGAWLVLQHELSAGMMIAASILLGRALAPVEQGIGQWPVMQRAIQGWRSLGDVLEKTAPERHHTRLPVPEGHVDLRGVTVIAPGESEPALRNISFSIGPGQALGVIGPSGAGKTTLAKVLTGIWPAAAGEVRLDGATLDQWPDDVRGRQIGYLPQEIGLLAGTVAQNISRFDADPDPARIVEASQRAGAHQLLLALPQGYDTEIGAAGQRLSGGQRQRVALARALYGDPALLILDEPNANLDSQGEQALIDAIRDAKTRGRAVIIMAHRPSAIAACDYLLMIDRGAQVEFGPRDEVLRARMQNHAPLLARQMAEAAAAQPTAAEPGSRSPGSTVAPEKAAKEKSPTRSMASSRSRQPVALMGDGR